MLALGNAGSAGTEKGVLPVLRDGALVATLHASNWKEAATATVGDRSWIFSKQHRELTGRWAAEPEGSARLRARQTSAWKGTWHLDLAGGWSPKPTLTTDPSLSLDHAVFLLWVELLIRKRAAAEAAAAGGAAVAG